VNDQAGLTAKSCRDSTRESYAKSDVPTKYCRHVLRRLKNQVSDPQDSLSLSQDVEVLSRARRTLIDHREGRVENRDHGLSSFPSLCVSLTRVGTRGRNVVSVVTAVVASAAVVVASAAVASPVRRTLVL
jgi:hypothetical protein